ncbi:MAG: gliding motility-associated C-terminal domain-containing protein, partial [Chitinophagales bacterium]|nr:gliding motility-associated C-terminal domain-containing protein [Chitinophagales bacterium]
IYQWYVNGLPVGLNASSYTSSSFVNGDQVTCSLTSNANCATGNPAVSNDVDIVVKANLPVSVTISEDKNNICSGTNVTFTAVPTNGGTTPVYQWKLNGVNVGSNSATYSNSTLANGDQITCVLTSNANCATGNPATSNTVTITVNPNLPVGVSIVASSSNICEGTNVTFTATPTNGGLNPVYQWYVNNIPVGTNSPTYSSGTLSMNDYVKVQLLSDALCAVSNPALSNEIKMIVHPNLPVSVGIIGNRNPACLGELVTFTATVVNGGSNPQYAWTLNGVPTGGNSNVLSSNSFIDGDKVKVTVTSNAICPTGNPAVSNEVELDIQSVSPSISGDVDFCYNSNTILDAGAGYSSYLWSNGSTTQTTTVNSSGEVRVVVSNGIGCFGRDTVNVIEYAEVLPNITGSLFFCWDGSSVLDAGAGYSGYVWSDGSTTQTTTVTAGGNYSVTVEDVHGCFGSDAVVVEENAAILYMSQVTDVRCNGGSDGSISVTASGGSGSYSYVWSDGQTTNPVTNLPSGDYSVTITDSKGCPLTTPNISVGEPTALALSLSNTSLGCYGDKNGSVTATVSGGTIPYSYLWTNGSTDAQITNLGAGTYGVAVVDGKGCTTTSSATLTEPGQLSFSVVSTDITCNGYNDGTISITNLVNAQGSVGYTLTPGVTQSGSVFGSLSPGGYVVVVKDSVGCSASTTATLTEPLPLLVDLGVSITLDLGETATLEPVVTGNQGSVGYAWTPTDYLSCVDCAQPTTTPLFDVVYTLVVEDQQACTATDNIGVLVEKTRDIFVPTAFSPNGDGTNDVLQVMPAKSIERVNLFQVFNRWGEKVFEASNYVPQIDTNGWDGSYKEKLQNVDVYVYFVEVTFIDGITGSAKGQVTLMK